MTWSSELRNNNNLPAGNYIKNKKGVQLVIAHEENLNLLIDELTQLKKAHKLSANGGLSKLFDALMSNKPKKFMTSGVEFNLKNCKSLVREGDTLGYTVMREYRLCTMMQDICERHLNQEFPEAVR